MKSNNLYSIRAIMLAVISLGIFTQFAYGQDVDPICYEFQLSGAIFTTDQFGNSVNMNIYNNKRHVYLDGGPGPGAPVGAAALPEGDYYFQVTDPSGQTLLSSDEIGARKFYVNQYGVIESANHDTNSDADYGEDPCNAVVVQLYPFDDTPNPGGVYKVWVTPVDCYDETEPQDGKHGFIPRFSKTDNFKVKGKIDQFLCVQKFKDCNGNGIWDDDEDEIDWKIIVQEPCEEPGVEPIEKKYCAPICIPAWTGCWEVTEEIKGDGCKGWKPTVVYVDGIKQTDPATSATVCFTGEVAKNNEAEIHTVVFGNQPLSSIKVIKFYDLNNNKVNDDGIFVPGIKFLLRAGDKDGEVIDTQYTDENGCARFCGLTGGIYTVEEVLPSSCNWVATTDTVIECIEVKDCQDPLEIPLEFGNIITGTACFSTKGYWHNKNGLTELTGGDISYVNSLLPYATPSSYFEDGDEPFDGLFSDGTLVDAAIGDGIWQGVNVAPAGTAKAEVSQFLVDSNANGDPREQLAQQLLAFIFNVRNRLDGDSAVILEPGLWEGPASDLITAAIAAWSVGDANLRNYYKNILDGLNNRECNPGVEYILPSPTNSCVTYPE